MSGQIDGGIWTAKFRFRGYPGWKITSGGTHPDVQTDMPKLGRYHVWTDVVSSLDGCYPIIWGPSEWHNLSSGFIVVPKPVPEKGRV